MAASVINFLTPIGVGAVASGSSQPYNYGGTSGDQGHGWQGTFSFTNTVFTGTRQVISIPTNAREASITFWYNGAGTVTLAIVGSNDSLANAVAGTAVFGTFNTSVAPATIAGGSSGSTAVTILLPAPCPFISFVIGGSGSTGADVIGCTVSCNTVIRP